jgi:hypothetical protein
MTMFANCPALMFNADFQPLSCFPLSLFGWEDSVKAVVKGSHVVVAEYGDSRRRCLENRWALRDVGVQDLRYPPFRKVKRARLAARWKRAGRATAERQDLRFPPPLNVNQASIPARLRMPIGPQGLRSMSSALRQLRLV